MFKHVCVCVYAYAFVLVFGEFCIKFIASHFPVLTLHFGSIFPLLIDFPYSTSETKKSSPKNLNVAFISFCYSFEIEHKLWFDWRRKNGEKKFEQIYR